MRRRWGVAALAAACGAATAIAAALLLPGQAGQGAGAALWLADSAPVIAGAIVVSLTLVAIAICIAGDPARGRRRCPRCWHDLSGTAGLTCPECGHAASHQRDLLRTRRRIGAAVALAAALLVAAVAVRFHATGESPWSVSPAGLEIALLPHLPPADADAAGASPSAALRTLLVGGIREDLLGRIARGELSLDALRALVESCAAGHEGARPGSAQWLSAYGDFVAMWISAGASAYASRPFRDADFADRAPDAGELAALSQMQDARRRDIEPLIERLTRLPPVISVDPAAAAPGAPSLAWLSVRGFVAEGGEVRIRITTDPSDALDPRGATKDARAAHDAAKAPQPGSRQELGSALSQPEPPLRTHAGRWIAWTPTGTGSPRMPVVLGTERTAPEGTRGIVVDIAWRPGPDAPWSLMRTVQDMPAPLEHGASPQPVTGTPLDAAVAAAFDDGVVLWQEGTLPAAIRFDAGATSGPEFRDVAVGLVIDMLEGSEVRRRTRIWWPGGDPQASMRAGWEPAEEDAQALRRLAEDPSQAARWSLRVRSDPDIARRALGTGRTSYWQGDLTLPLKVRPRGGASPPRRFTFADPPPVPSVP